MPEVTLAVLGATGVGKSTFIHCALDLKQPANSSTSAKKMALDGVVYLVRLIEIQLDSISITTDYQINWPQVGSEQGTMRIDGALALYDVLNEESLACVPELLSESPQSKKFICRLGSVLALNSPTIMFYW